MRSSPTFSEAETRAPEPDAGGGESPGLADRLRQATLALHCQAERSGIVRDLLRGTACRDGYRLYLFNLLPAYRALEAGLQMHGTRPELAGLAQAAVYRAPALQSDIEGLASEAADPPLLRLPDGQDYAERIETVATQAPHRLIAHAYVRYLGDLNGGHILGRLVAKQFSLSDACLGFYRFPRIADLDRFKARYRAGIDRAPLTDDQSSDVIEEGVLAFKLNIDVSAAVQKAVAPRGSL